MAKEKEKDVVNVGVPADVYKRFAAYCDRRHMIKRDTAGAVLAWFLVQPDAAKAVVLGVVDEGLEEAYAAILDALAKETRAVPLIGSTREWEGPKPGEPGSKENPLKAPPVEFVDLPDEEPDGPEHPAPSPSTTGEHVVADVEVLDGPEALLPAPRPRRRKKSRASRR